MAISVIERVMLTHLQFEMDVSDATLEMTTQVIEYARVNHGHEAAEAVAKELREIIEAGTDEAEFLWQMASRDRLKNEKEGRSSILIIRSLQNLDLEESTVRKVLSILIDERRRNGQDASETVATLLMQLIDSCKTNDEVLQAIKPYEVGDLLPR